MNFVLGFLFLYLSTQTEGVTSLLFALAMGLQFVTGVLRTRDRS